MNEPLNPQALTWALLLSRWTDFARSALALPTDAPGKALRKSVPDIIMLQAVWFALHHLEELAPGERALGLDRAQILIDKHAASLARLWRDHPMPPQITDLIADAQTQLQKAL